MFLSHQKPFRRSSEPLNGCTFVARRDITLQMELASQYIYATSRHPAVRNTLTISPPNITLIQNKVEMSNITMDYRASSPPIFPLSPTKQENPMSPDEFEEEGLPLYRSSLSEEDPIPTSSHDELHSHTPSLPARHARPDEIRDSLAYLLVKQRGFSQDHARDIAARWTVGSGLELRQYSPSMFFEVFGREDGWVLFREVRVALWKFVVRYKVCELRPVSYCVSSQMMYFANRHICRFLHPLRQRLGDGHGHPAGD